MIGASHVSFILLASVWCRSECVTILANKRMESDDELLGKVLRARENRHKGRCQYLSAAQYLQTGSHFLIRREANIKAGMRKAE